VVFESLRTYFELNQKLAHFLDVHYLSDREAWCTLNQFGDLVDFFKVHRFERLPNGQSGIVVSTKLAELREYAGIENFCLLRMFDFSRFRGGSFVGWTESAISQAMGNQGTVFGKLAVSSQHSYSRGIQKLDCNSNGRYRQENLRVQSCRSQTGRKFYCARLEA
jgi:hypothetical protein